MKIHSWRVCRDDGKRLQMQDASDQPRSQGFSLLVGGGPPAPHEKGKALGTRLSND